MVIGIVAVDAGNGIGINGQLPWPKLQEDMLWFKQQTSNNIVLMGSTTWKSIGSVPLPNRINGVVSRFNKDRADYIFFNPEYAISFFSKIFSSKDVYVIGGQKIYNSTMEFVDKWYITEINETYDCDCFFNYDLVKSNFPNKTIIKEIKNTVTTPSYKIIEYVK